MSALEEERPSSSVSVGGKDWSGKAEQLLQQQLKSVQEECKQLREAYRQGDGSGGRLSRNSRSNSTQSLPQSSVSVRTKPHPLVDVSPPSLSTSLLKNHTPTPYFSSTASLSSLKSTQSEQALPAMTSLRHHQTRTSHTPRYVPRQVSSTPQVKQSGVARGEWKRPDKTGTHTSAKSSEGRSSSPGRGRADTSSTASTPYKFHPTSSGGGGGGWQQKKDYGRAGLSHFSTPAYLLDSGYSSGSGQKSRTLRHVSPSAGGRGFAVTSASGSVSNSKRLSATPAAAFSGSPLLPHPPPLAMSVSIPATVSSLLLGGREELKSGERSNGTAEERDRGRVRQLEHEVSVLEEQLSEKTQSARSHVEDLMCMRSELARERAALARERQESREAATAELRREKTAHVEQCRELTGQLERLRGEKRDGDREIGTFRASLKVSEAEVLRLSEAMTRLTQQLQEERESHAATSRSLHATAEEGRTQVAALDQSLQVCQDEVSRHLSRVGEMERAQRSELDSLKSKISSLDAVRSAAMAQLQDKTEALSGLQDELARARAQHDQELQDRADTMTRLQDDLTRVRTQQEREMEGRKRGEQDLKRSLVQSERVRQSLLLQVEKNGQELERLTRRLAEVQGREEEAERSRAESQQLRRIVGEVRRAQEEQKAEGREGQEERRRLQVELGLLQARLDSASSQLQQARNREEEYSRATAELIKEAGQVRAESGRVKSQLETCQRDLEEVRGWLREKEESEQSTVAAMKQELAARAQQVLEVEQLLRTQKTEATSQRLELERNLAQSQSDLRTRTQQLEQVTGQLSQSVQTVEQLQAEVTRLQSAEQTRSSHSKKQLAAKDSAVAVLRSQLQSLQETHSAVLASSEQQADVHRRAKAWGAQQLRSRLEELSRTRAQVSSLSTELSVVRKSVEGLQGQLTLARAEAARYQAQVSSMQRAVSLGNMTTLGAGLHRPPSSSQHCQPTNQNAVLAWAGDRAAKEAHSDIPTPHGNSSGHGSQKRGQVIDL